ncbi:MAG TPA: hypothetical protein VG125_06505 [Pirellulales bacterium]|nr:hypothetical protein [Pirellulales bacterium]
MKRPAPQSSQNAPSSTIQPTGDQASPFCHQRYTAEPPRVPHFYVQAAVGPPVSSRDFQRRMRHVGQALKMAGVGAIYLVHSSFAALDSLNILASLARNCRSVGPSIRRVAARLIDADGHDAGNYTMHYAGLLEAALGSGAPPVKLAAWSSENHHLGRADAAVRLIDELAALELAPGERVMLWGHGHAGNVFAIMTQLLTCPTAAVERFFDAAAVYYRLPFTGLTDIPVWHRVRQLLTRDRQRVAERLCDWVTFGTPVRYGWKLRNDDNLLHFVHHRPVAGGPAHLAVFPPRPEDVLSAAGGDYLQQVAIAGTDAPPSPPAWRSWLANRRLGKLLESQPQPIGLANSLETGMRVPDSGTTLLVDYGPLAGTPAEQLAGHAVYTRPEWLLFHAEQIVERLFEGSTKRRCAA